MIDNRYRVSSEPSRRTFMRTLAAVSAASYGRVLGANERVQVGFIGCGLVATQHIYDFKNQKDADLVAACDVYQPRVEQGLAALGNPNAKGYGDFRTLLDNKDIQAVVVSTPDHWHPLATGWPAPRGRMFTSKSRSRDSSKKADGWCRPRASTIASCKRELRTAVARIIDGLPVSRSGQMGKIHSLSLGHHRNIFPGFRTPRRTAAGRPRLRYVAGAVAQASVRQQSRFLSFPLVLGLLRRPDDKLGRS